MNEVAHAFLARCGALQTPHSGRSLYEHLCGTEQLLLDWQCASTTAVAGLFHSIYGTNAYGFSSLSLNDRQALESVIGPEAEQLVYLFAIGNRPASLLGALTSNGITNRLNGQFLQLREAQLDALIEIECANLIEQDSASRFFVDLLDEVEAGSIDLKPRVLEAVQMRVTSRHRLEDA
jgi:hypothetical protein